MSSAAFGFILKEKKYTQFNFFYYNFLSAYSSIRLFDSFHFILYIFCFSFLFFFERSCYFVLVLTNINMNAT